MDFYYEFTHKKFRIKTLWIKDYKKTPVTRFPVDDLIASLATGAGFNLASGKSSRVLYFPGDTRSTKDTRFIFPGHIMRPKFIASTGKYLHYFVLIVKFKVNGCDVTNSDVVRFTPLKSVILSNCDNFLRSSVWSARSVCNDSRGFWQFLKILGRCFQQYLRFVAFLRRL